MELTLLPPSVNVRVYSVSWSNTCWVLECEHEHISNVWNPSFFAFTWFTLGIWSKCCFLRQSRHFRVGGERFINVHKSGRMFLVSVWIVLSHFSQKLRGGNDTNPLLVSTGITSPVVFFSAFELGFFLLAFPVRSPTVCKEEKRRQTFIYHPLRLDVADNTRYWHSIKLQLFFGTLCVGPPHKLNTINSNEGQLYSQVSPFGSYKWL